MERLQLPDCRLRGIASPCVDSCWCLSETGSCWGEFLTGSRQNPENWKVVGRAKKIAADTIAGGLGYFCNLAQDDASITQMFSGGRGIRSFPFHVGLALHTQCIRVDSPQFPTFSQKAGLLHILGRGARHGQCCPQIAPKNRGPFFGRIGHTRPAPSIHRPGIHALLKDPLPSWTKTAHDERGSVQAVTTS